MQRTAVVIVLGIALAFASIPGVIALSFAGSSSFSDDLASRLETTTTVTSTISVTDTLTMGVSDSTGCSGDSGVDASRF